jgi:hypothetical protein
MGRTNPTFRDVLRAMERRWGDYRRGLRRRDQERFDQLFVDAAQYADAAGYLNHEEPFHPVLFSICLAQQRRIESLQDQVADLEGTPATEAE